MYVASSGGGAVPPPAPPTHLAVLDVGKSTNIRWQETMVSRSDKELLLGQRGCVLWFTGERAAEDAAAAVLPPLFRRSHTLQPSPSPPAPPRPPLAAGLSGSGKSTVACTLEHLLHERGHLTSLLDGDNIRHGLNKDLGFT